MKSYKRLLTAKRNAEGAQIVQAGEFYIVGMQPLDTIRVIGSDGTVKGHITVKKLCELGNANWATRAPKWVEAENK